MFSTLFLSSVIGCVACNDLTTTVVEYQCVQTVSRVVERPVRLCASKQCRCPRARIHPVRTVSHRAVHRVACRRCTH